MNKKNKLEVLPARKKTFTDKKDKLLVLTEGKKTFTSKGMIYRPRGRQPLLVETARAETFLHHLEQVDKKALTKITKRLFELAMQKNNDIVATRACEIILAYGLGKPTTVEHSNESKMEITFVRSPSNVQTSSKTIES